MKTLVLPRPQEKQMEFMRAGTKHVGFGGARGGGKSWAVRTKAILLALRYGGIRILIVRRSYPELMNNHILILRRQLQDIAIYNDKQKTLAFPNASTISFTYCAKDGDLDRLQGVEYDVIFLDEATQFSEFQMKTIVACLRGVNSFPKRIYYTCNPGGRGHGYIKRIFLDRRYEEGEDPSEYTFIPSRVTDNQALLKAQPDYLKQLKALPPKLRKAWLEGDWNVFEGQFFEEFADRPEHYADRRWTHVIEPFAIDPSWRIYRSFDWGYHRPFSCGWWAVDSGGVVYRILELYGCTGVPNEGVRWTPDKVFSEIHRIETEHPWLSGKHIVGVADPAIWDGETGESIADTAARHQVYFMKGDNKRIPGWLQLHYRLRFDEEGLPLMYVFSNCKAFIRTLPLLQYDEQLPEDLDTRGEDHVADEARYFLMSRPIAPRLEKSAEAAQGASQLFLDIPHKNLPPARISPKMEFL
ncbi:MAG: phage terminase large subunit [Oscillospiraceae bacterium]|nr:phage terminase large subunit [Oscillospiraceae bacterium]